MMEVVLAVHAVKDSGGFIVPPNRHLIESERNFLSNFIFRLFTSFRSNILTRVTASFHFSFYKD